MLWSWTRYIGHFTLFNFKYFRKLNLFQKSLALLYTFVLCLLLTLAAIETNFLWLFGRMPGMSMVSNPDLAIASEIYSEDSVLLGKYFIENRSPILYEEIPKALINTLLVTEDVRFYAHHGVDLRAIGSAVYFSLKGEKRGGSTLTQQLAKNLFKTRREVSKGLLSYIPVVNTLVAKVKESVTALKLELFYSKSQILTMYFNTVDFGANAFGIKSAALTFFGKEPRQLTYPEMATLIGMLKAPTFYSPKQNPQNALLRRNVVLGQLAKYGKINKENYNIWIKSPIELKYRVEKHSEGIAPYFRQAASVWLKKWCADNGYNLYTDGLIIRSTLNPAMQAYAEQAVADKMKMLQERFYRHWPKNGPKPWMEESQTDTFNYLYSIFKKTERYKQLKSKGTSENKIWQLLRKPVPMSLFTWKGVADTSLSPIDSLIYELTLLQCGMVTLDPHTGQIKTWIGGDDYGYYKYDHVSQSKRQPGSTFKPFVYATALEQGWGPCDKMVDRPVTINYVEDGKPMSWSPHNADWTFTGTEMTLRRAMAKSVNSITAQLTEKVTPQAVADLAQKMGIQSPLKPVPSIGLGSNEVTLFELVGAYGTFINKGEWIAPHFITAIYDRSGKLLYKANPERKQVLTPETAWLMTYMFRGGVEEPGGTSQALFEFEVTWRNEVGGKTGTSSDYADGWFIGITKELITGTWVGCDDRKIHFRTSQTGEGSKTALPIYGTYMDLMYADPKIPIKKGMFPQPTVPIQKPHNCRTWLPKAPDSLSIDKDIQDILIEQQQNEQQGGF